MSHDDMITIHADILQITDSAVFADCAGEEVWLPLSQVDFNGEKGDVDVPITLPEWLADGKGLSDGDGMHRAAVPPPNESESISAPASIDPPDTTRITLTIISFSEDGDLALVEDRHGNQCELSTHDFVHDDNAIDAGTTILCHVQNTALTAGDCNLVQDEPEVILNDDDSNPDITDSYADASFLKTETITVSIPLDLEERESVGDRMASALEQIAELEDDLDSYRKRINAEIKSLQKDAERARKEWQEGKIENDVYCDVMADYSAEAIIWLVHDTIKEMKRRPMTAEERQYRLPIPRPGSESVNYASDAARNMKDVEAIFGKTRAHSCIDCGNLAQDDSAMPEPCQSCSQCHNGDSDNWTPRRECRTCSHSQTQVNMPPCAGCALNVEERYQGDANGWEWQEATAGETDMPLNTDQESVVEHMEEPSEEGFFDPSTGAITPMHPAASHDGGPTLPQ